MAFPSDGQNHHKAVESEKNLVSYKEQIEIHYGKSINEITQFGGTKTKVDNLITFGDESSVSVSLKNKRELKSGSFDYVNTSNFDWANDGFSKSISVYNQYRGSGDKKAYEILKSAIAEELNNMSDEMLTNLFKTHVIEKYNDLSLFVIDEKSKKIYCDVIPPSFDPSKSCKLTLATKTGDSMSRKVYSIDDNGNKKDFFLRIRVHLNNGSTKWLKGESSVLVFKFQQDSVHKIV